MPPSACHSDGCKHEEHVLQPQCDSVTLNGMASSAVAEADSRCFFPKLKIFNSPLLTKIIIFASLFIIMEKTALIARIERFIKKFYLNRLIQGTLTGLILMIVLFLIVNGIEYFSWLPQKGRLILLLLFILGTLFVAIFFFAVPIVNLIRFRKKMSDEQASVIIGKFFPEISDKLLNTIQLSNELSQNSDNQLLIATIEQRTENLKPINFSDAVNFKDNYKYLKIFGFAFIVLTVTLIFLPDFSKKPTQRIINYSQEYVKPLPFSVELSATSLEVTQGKDAKISIHVSGERIPDAFYVKGSNGIRLMNKLSTNDFRFIFKNVNQKEDFFIEGGDYRSPVISLNVRPNPTMLCYEAKLTFPKYINRKNETLDGKTHIIAPQGTNIEFTFHTRDVDSISIAESTNTNVMENHYSPIQQSSNEYVFNLHALKSTKFTVTLYNNWNISDAIPFTVEVIPDAYPDIQVQHFHENFSKQTYYSGLIADDYGFTKLLYHLEVDGKPNLSFIKNIPFDKRNIRTSFYYSIDIDTLILYRGDEVKAYFEIFDNDGINGAKSKRSEVFYFSLPTTEQLDSIANSSENQILDNLSQRSDELQNLRKDIENMLRDLMAKKELDWSDKEKMKDLLEKQKEVRREWEKIQEEQKELSDFIRENELSSEELIKKQEEIHKLFDELIPDEMKKLMEEIEQLLNDMPREKMQEIMKELKKNNVNLQKMMERNLSLLEQLKVEKDMNLLLEKMQELADELLENTDSISAQEAVNQFNKIEQNLDSIIEKNNGLNDPFDINKDEQAFEEIQQDLENAADYEDEGEKDNAKQQKQKAGQKMKEMGEKMSSLMMGGEMDQLAEDAHLVRILLENIVRSSHAEEELMQKISIMKKDDPTVSQKIARQKEISENFVMVEDSLRKMANRQTSIKNFVFSELQIINQQLSSSMQDILELKFGNATHKQQNAMMSMNNLALMLAESLNEMESMMDGSGSSCSKPSKSKDNKGKQKTMKNMKDLQKQLGEQLKQMQQQMQQQQKDGSPMDNMSEEFARMAAQQELIREGMQQILDEMKQNGILGDDGINQIIKDMEKLEEDIVNKRITNQTIRRNKDIMSRMLKAEKAQQEREKEEKRKSDEYKGPEKKRDIDELRYEESIKKQQDFLRTNPIEYQPFYKQKINEYFFNRNRHLEQSLFPASSTDTFSLFISRDLFSPVCSSDCFSSVSSTDTFSSVISSDRRKSRNLLQTECYYFAEAPSLPLRSSRNDVVKFKLCRNNELKTI